MSQHVISDIDKYTGDFKLKKTVTVTDTVQYAVFYLKRDTSCFQYFWTPHFGKCSFCLKKV